MYRTRHRRVRERIPEPISAERRAEMDCHHWRLRERMISLELEGSSKSRTRARLPVIPDPHPWHAGLGSCPDRDGLRWSRELRQWVPS
jgi:hypothetical protein